MPGRRLRDRLPQGARHRPPQPAAAARAALEALAAVGAAREVLRRPRGRRGHGRRRLCRRAGRARGGASGTAAGPDRGRQPPRARQPAAGRPGAAGLPRLPDRGQRGRAVPGHRPAGPDAVFEGRPGRGAGSGSGSPPTPAACSSSAAAWAPARSTSPRSRLSPSARGATFDVVHIAGSRDYAELQQRLAAAPHAERYTLLDYEPDLGDALAAGDLVLARSGGSIFEIAAAGRPGGPGPVSLTPPPTTRRANAALDGAPPVPPA